MGLGALPCERLGMTPEEFWRILHEVPPARPIFYRLYHDDKGRPIVYSMEDLPGNYIEVDPFVFGQHRYDLRVVEGRIEWHKTDHCMPKLRPHASRGTACHPEDVCVIVDESQPHIKWTLHHED